MNQDKQCNDCIWTDLCDHEEICDHYYPSDGEDFYETVEAIRRRLYADWTSYIGEFN